MKIVKLDAIDSTNRYLKELARQETLENWTVVWAHSQTQGKGQMSSQWLSEPGKNLTFSVLVKFDKLTISNQHYLNYMSSLAIFNVLKFYIPDKLAVKWPNDILSAGNKIGGILTECTLKNNQVLEAVIGIGLNVNQVQFSDNILNPTSLRLKLNREIDLSDLFHKILMELQFQMLAIQQERFEEIKQTYLTVLYKIGIPSKFIDLNKHAFLGKITGVSDEGKLIVELEDESYKEFDLKEIKFN